MKIVLNEVTKNGELYKEDGTLISTYSYKNALSDDFTINDLKSDLEKFNVTLSKFEDFDDIKELRNAINVHNWD